MDCPDDRAKNYEELSKFVKVMAKILWVPVFRTQCKRCLLYKASLSSIFKQKPIINLYFPINMCESLVNFFHSFTILLVIFINVP